MPSGKEYSASNFQNEQVMEFGPPPTLLVGLITGLLGAGAGVVSLLLYFKLWQPESYISQQWLIFVIAGAIVGFYLRIERIFQEGLSETANGRQR